MKIVFECLYCGHTFIAYFYSEDGAKEAKCEKCRDKNLKIRENTEGDVYGYYKK